METAEQLPAEVSHYTYRVVWSPEDDEFVATVAEFASLSWLAPSQIEALQGLEALLVEVLRDLEREAEDIPAPLSERAYSGKLNLRLGGRLHREVALQAAEENLSINQWIVRRLVAEH